jgi:hypothetical protein
VVERRPDERRLLGMQHRLDAHHAIGGVPACDPAPLSVALGIGIRVVKQDGSVLAADGLELVPRAAPRDLEQRGLVLGRRDTRDRADLRVRDLAAAQGVVEEREVGEPIGDAEVFARGTEAPADAPGQPVGTAPCTLRVPAAAPIERAQVAQQPMQCRVEVRCLLGDPLSQRLQIL